MNERPRIVVIEGDPSISALAEMLAPHADVVRTDSVESAIEHLQLQQADGLATTTLVAPGVALSASDILQQIATGIAIVNGSLKVMWHNVAFGDLCGGNGFVGKGIYEAVACEEITGPDFCPFSEALAGNVSTKTRIRLKNGRHVEIRVQRLLPQVLLSICRDITSEIQEREKMTSIHRAGLELGHLTPAELALMSTEERVDLLKANILQHSQNILNFRSLEIRLLEPETKNLKILLSEGMSDSAGKRELLASTDGNGVTGFVAATGTSYICVDVVHDPLYLPGADGARSSITVPILYRDRVIGTFNVESTDPGKFTESDREFLEIFAREIAVALHTLELLEAEKQIGGTATVEAIVHEVSLPVDEIVSDTIRVLDFLLQPAGNKDLAHEAVRRILMSARSIKSAIQKVGREVEQETSRGPTDQPTRLTGKRVLVVDADPNIRRSAHVLLSQLGCEVDTAKDGLEAQQWVRTIEADVILGDIRLPDMNGYEFFSAMKKIAPKTPIVLMTGFGYDATHSIVRAKQEGLASVLYKPFRLDRIRESVADALKFAASGSGGADWRRPSGLETGAKQKLL
ncbi:response regulator [bacterium]|nr:response regulator [bacterium]